MLAAIIRSAEGADCTGRARGIESELGDVGGSPALLIPAGCGGVMPLQRYFSVKHYEKPCLIKNIFKPMAVATQDSSLPESLRP